MLKKYSKTGLVWLWVTVLLVAVDRYTKYWVMHHLMLYQPVQVLPIFDLTLSYNTGAAFGFLHKASGWQNSVLGSFALLVSIIILYWLSTLPMRARWMSIGLCFILSGALGNVWDRMLYGYVIDFLSFHLSDWYFAIFNVADSAITIGALMVFWSWFKLRK